MLHPLHVMLACTCMDVPAPHRNGGILPHDARGGVNNGRRTPTHGEETSSSTARHVKAVRQRMQGNKGITLYMSRLPRITPMHAAKMLCFGGVGPLTYSAAELHKVRSTRPNDTPSSEHCLLYGTGKKAPEHVGAREQYTAF